MNINFLHHVKEVFVEASSKWKINTACFIMNVPILKPYISATTKPK